MPSKEPNAIERLRAELAVTDCNCQCVPTPCSTCTGLAAVEALYQAAKNVVQPFGNDEVLGGWDGSELLAAVRRVEGCEALDAIPVDPEGDAEQQTMQRFWEEGLVFLANLSIFHPRGYALTVSVKDGQVKSMFVQGNGYEPFVFAHDVDDSLAQVLNADREREHRRALAATDSDTEEGEA